MHFTAALYVNFTTRIKGKFFCQNIVRFLAYMDFSGHPKAFHTARDIHRVAPHVVEKAAFTDNAGNQ